MYSMEGRINLIYQLIIFSILCFFCINCQRTPYEQICNNLDNVGIIKIGRIIEDKDLILSVNASYQKEKIRRLLKFVIYKDYKAKLLCDIGGKV